MAGYDHYREASELIEELRMRGFDEEADGLREAIDSGSTGTETFMALRWKLDELLDELELPDLPKARAKRLRKELDLQLR